MHKFLPLILFPTLFLMLFSVSVTAYPTCQTVIIKNYQYDLSRLPSSDFIGVKGSKVTVQFFFCKPGICDNLDSFAFFKDAKCTPYTNNQNPLIQNYTMIDADAPKKGIKLNFLPFSDETANNTLKYTVLNIFCPQFAPASNQCTKTQSQVLECNYESIAGCPSLRLNYFWQFLSSNSIVFAILLWIMALFELLLGYLAIRMTIFIYGVLSGTIFGIIYTAENYENFIYQSEGYGIAVFIICLSFLMGILFGMALLTLPRLGYVNIGLWVAFIFSLLLQNSVLFLTGSLLAFYITVGVVGFLMATIALLKVKNYIILSTSFTSAFWLIRPIGFFLPYYPNEFRSGESYLLNSSTDWQFYLYLISIIVLTILGAVFQFCCFAKSATGNQTYYLEQNGSLKEKFKRLLQFQEIKNFIKSGVDQIKFFKDIIVNDQDEQSRLGKKYSKKTEDDQSEGKLSQSRQESDSQRSSTGRKKTKLQIQMQDYQAKRAKKQQKKPADPLISVKNKQKPMEVFKKKNKKVEQVPLEQVEEEDKKSDDEQSEDIRPNKLALNNRRKG